MEFFFNCDFAICLINSYIHIINLFKRFQIIFSMLNIKGFHPGYLIINKGLPIDY